MGLLHDRKGVLLCAVSWPRVPPALVRARPVLLPGTRHLRGESEDVLHVLGGAVSAKQRYRNGFLLSECLPAVATVPVALTKQAKIQSKGLHTRASSHCKLLLWGATPPWQVAISS